MSPAKVVDFTLDGNGNILTVTDSTAEPSSLLYTYTYEKLNHVITVQAHYVNKFLDYEYDRWG